MVAPTRREFLRRAAVGVGLAGGSALLGSCASIKGTVMPATSRRVVVIGGGWGGATAAKYVRLSDQSIEVVLIEPNREFVSCPFSNLVLSGTRSIDSLTLGYEGLRKHGVKLIHEMAKAIEPDAKRVRIAGGYVEYDRLVVAPGIDFRWDQVDGLAPNKDKVLHAWKAGAQTVALANQIQSMPDGGTFVLSIPPVAYRCPPGPYERVCQVAWYLKGNKPRSRIIVLDANPGIVSKAALFRDVWKTYPNIDYRASSKVVAIDPGIREVRTEFERVKYDVVNLIPPQQTSPIAIQADLVVADGRWCGVNHVTYESVKHSNIHVIGDSVGGGALAIPTPKSGSVANAMGKICAIVIVQLLEDKPVPELPPGNVCYSWVNDLEAIAVVNAYKIENGKVVPLEQVLTPAPSTSVGRRALGWAQSIWSDMLS
jgi:sulfide dehydrogenase [flavocytochrome c] flavoprotein chain